MPRHDDGVPVPDRVTATESPRLALVGPGRAGGAVAGALVAAGWQLTGVAGRDPAAASVRATAARFGAAVGTPREVVGGVDLVVVATPDHAIDAVATAIADAVAPDALVVHLSGARGLDALAARPTRGPAHSIRCSRSRTPWWVRAASPACTPR